MEYKNKEYKFLKKFIEKFENVVLFIAYRACCRWQIL